MKDLIGAAYWVLVGALVVPALCFTLLYHASAYLLLVPTALGLVGALSVGFGTRGRYLSGSEGCPPRGSPLRCFSKHPG